MGSGTRICRGVGDGVDGFGGGGGEGGFPDGCGDLVGLGGGRNVWGFLTVERVGKDALAAKERLVGRGGWCGGFWDGDGMGRSRWIGLDESILGL